MRKRVGNNKRREKEKREDEPGVILGRGVSESMTPKIKFERSRFLECRIRKCIHYFDKLIGFKVMTKLKKLCDIRHTTLRIVNEI